MNRQPHTPYPELMSERQLAAAFREADSRIGQELVCLLGDRNSQIALLEELTESGDTRRRCAILQSLRCHAEDLSSDSRRFLLPRLIDLLSDDSAEIRTCARDCAAEIIAAQFEEDPTVWSQALRRLLFVGTGSSGARTDRIRAGSALRGLLETVYERVPESSRRTVTNVCSNYFKSTGWDRISCLSLLKGITNISCKVWGTMQRGHILGFVRYFLKNDTGEVRLASLLLLHRWLGEGWKPSRDFSDYLSGALDTACSECSDGKGDAALLYISAEIRRLLAGAADTDRSLSTDASPLSAAPDKSPLPAAPEDDVLYRENLDSGVDGLTKWINLMILRERYRPEALDVSGYGAHLLVFLRLNTEAVLFRKAGEDLLRIMDRLREHQKREIMAELFKCAELQDDSTRYLPFLIGQCWFHLAPDTQEDLIPEMQRLANSDQTATVEIITSAACGILARLSSGDGPDAQDHHALQKIRRGMAGILFQGIYSDRRTVSENTFYAVGLDLFRNMAAGADPAASGDAPGAPTATAAPAVPAGEILEPAVAVARSALMYLQAAGQPDPLFRSLPVHEIACRLTEISDFYEDPQRPVAFYSGSFDPFANGDRAVARELAEMGMQVYISVDDFSWIRNTQPAAVRRKIVLLSIADMAHVQIFPQDAVINTENPADLQQLRGLFPGRKVYLVCGSDRIENAPAYRMAPSEGSVHSFPHIVFTRDGAEAYGSEPGRFPNLTGEVIELRLPIYYDNMTSLQVRHHLREGIHIDDLVTVPARQYIRRGNLYTDERIYKKEIETRRIETSAETSGGQIRITLQDVWSGEVLGELLARSQEADTTAAGTPGTAPDGAAAGSPGRPLFRTLEIVSLTCLEDADGTQSGMVLDEALLYFQAHGYEMVTVSGSLCGRELLRERGFVRIPGNDGRYCTDLRSPVVLFDDAASYILEPFAGEPSLEAILKENERRLRLGIAGLYPGTAVLFLSRRVLNDRLVRRIRERYGLPEDTDALYPEDSLPQEDPSDVRETLTDRICVPFGKFQRSVQIPGLVTMPLNTEKVYSPDLGSYDIRETPGAPDLSVQMRVLKSMDRPFILLVDLYNNGYWLKTITKGLGALSLQEEGVIAGAVSGYGRSLAQQNHLKIDAIYEIPHMRAWFRVSDITPFYAGDRVRPQATALRPEEDPMDGRLPSTYPILPYQMPASLSDVPYPTVYDLSMTCLENTRRLFAELESLYEARYARRLTLGRLKEVVENPGWPETAMQAPDARRQKVSSLLDQDILRLQRLNVHRSV